MRDRFFGPITFFILILSTVALGVGPPLVDRWLRSRESAIEERTAQAAQVIRQRKVQPQIAASRTDWMWTAVALGLAATGAGIAIGYRLVRGGMARPSGSTPPSAPAVEEGETWTLRDGTRITCHHSEVTPEAAHSLRGEAQAHTPIYLVRTLRQKPGGAATVSSFRVPDRHLGPFLAEWGERAGGRDTILGVEALGEKQQAHVAPRERGTWLARRLRGGWEALHASLIRSRH